MSALPVTMNFRRLLGVWDFISLGLGGIIGGGIFIITGMAAAQYAGPAIISCGA
jgi:basic amino acid/polyamine antiporter, APA family